jgi:hypothetical protein
LQAKVTNLCTLVKTYQLIFNIENHDIYDAKWQDKYKIFCGLPQNFFVTTIIMHDFRAEVHTMEGY